MVNLLRFLYIFDVAEEIKIGEIEKILNKVAKIFEMKIDKYVPTHYRVTSKPLRVDLRERKIENNNVNVSAEIYDNGVITITLDLKIENIDLDKIFEIITKQNFEKVATDILNKIIENIRNEIIEYSERGEKEEYIIVFLDVKEKVEEFLNKNKSKIAKILELDENLSKEQIEENIRNKFQYYEDEVIFVSWNSAICINVDEIEEISFIFKVANIQLLELRTNDYYLDELLKEFKISRNISKKIGKRLNEIIETRIKIQEMIESSLNLGKFFGDWYYAKIFKLISKELHLDEWRGNLFRKFSYLENLYINLFNKSISQKTYVMEVLIVLLFIIDLFLIVLLGI